MTQEVTTEVETEQQELALYRKVKKYVDQLQRSISSEKSTDWGMYEIAEGPNSCGFGKDYPEFWLNHRPGRQMVDDTGMHICLRAPGVDAVKAFYEVALAAGASCAGEPGFRPQYSEQYYAAFINDLDGSKIKVVTFADLEPLDE